MCEKWIKKRDVLDGEMKTIDDEIADLERKIEEKRQEREKREKAKQEIVDEIDAIKENYKDREDEITEIQRQIQTNEHDSEECKETISDEELHVKELEQDRNSRVERRDALLATVVDIKGGTQKAQTLLDAQIVQRQRLRNEIVRLLSASGDCKAKAVELEAQKSECQERIARDESQIAERVAKIMSNKVVLGQMEDEKKAFATARKFKEASKVAGDIKNLQNVLETAEKEVEQLRKQKEECEKQVAGIEVELGTVKTAAKSTEIELNKATFREIQMKIGEIEQLEKGVSEIKPEELALLQRQIGLFKDEAKTMKEKWGYLEECEYEGMDKEKAKKLLEGLQEEQRKLEAEVEELSGKEDYEGADAKQSLLNVANERIKKLEGILENA